MGYILLKLLIIYIFIFSFLQADKPILVKNNCASVITVGVLTNGISSSFPELSFDLTPSASNSFSKPDSWGGRVWARYHCSGSAGKDAQNCGVPGAVNPASLAEFFFKGTGGKDFYDISLVDGYNMPLSISPSGGSKPDGYECGSPICSLSSCPPEYAVTDATGSVVSCMSACSKTGSPQDCCTGNYNTPETCKQNAQAADVKQRCPDAYSFAYDDQKSTYSCEANGYTITFC
ncbi:thaumatin [Cokeromyces recurvatus]|uniref:thaumatin n=1 Tax=Cokeromyces recurvatus TaxID=90255 RepID=UPI002220A786|nr:thaumatin [Cokeromyces recurvatus]KAI7908199.1 thaumatin [Cokeromyces recurvatus]